ncbi:MAG: hypothetical protein RLZ10_2365 [Bacteroidota bacterium]|jgi:hypothetical protein
MSKKQSIGLFDMLDQCLAQSLGVDVETYIKIIEHKCTEEDATAIIMTLLDSEDKPEEIAKAKAIFDQYNQ